MKEMPKSSPPLGRDLGSSFLLYEDSAAATEIFRLTFLLFSCRTGVDSVDEGGRIGPSLDEEDDMPSFRTTPLGPRIFIEFSDGGYVNSQYEDFLGAINEAIERGAKVTACEIRQPDAGWAGSEGRPA